MDPETLAGVQRFVDSANCGFSATANGQRVDPSRVIIPNSDVPVDLEELAGPIAQTPASFKTVIT